MARADVKNGRDTAARILDCAESLVQIRGFNGFSYADVAGELAVTTASLHYHFPGKAELGRALIARYASRFYAALAAIDATGESAPAKLERYVQIYADVVRAQRMCLCGMLAAEYQTLPEPMRAAVLRFFEQNEAWVESVLAAGREAGALVFEGDAREAAQQTVSALEGAMLVARPYGGCERFEIAARRLLASFTAPAPAARPR